MVITAGIAVAAVYSYFSQDLPSPDRLQTQQNGGSTKILDRNGKLLYELFDPQAGRRTSVPLSEISPDVIHATIDIEDSTFYDNPGVSIRGTLRAAIAILRGEEIQGGSTITQQLIKRVLLTPQVSIDRKIQEWILAYRVNQMYSKDQILDWYLNEIYYGNMSTGIEAAAESYFGKSAKDLDLAQSAMLAGLPQAPSLLSPLVDPKAAKERQRLVLDAMVRQRDITQAQADAAFKEPLVYRPMKYSIEAPHFVMYVRDLLEQKYGPKALYSEGLTVRTTLDLNMQHEAEQIIRQHVAKLATDNIHNAALVAMQPGTGEILAMVGSANYFDPSIDGQVNMATAERQPGSTFKPITYAGAFMKGWSPGTVLLDYYTVFKDRLGRPYTPHDFEPGWRGPVTVRSALANSMNVPAVKTMEFVGVKNAINLAHKMGITTINPNGPYDLSLALGVGGVKLLDMVYAYSVFANNGVMNGEPVPKDQQIPGYRTLQPVSILSVTDSSGKVLEQYNGPDHAQVLSPQVSYLITNILSDNAARSLLFGANDPLNIGRPAAAKTGTTDENRDLWTIGYTPDLVTGVWVGNSDNQPIAQTLSTLTAAPIWHDFMAQATKNMPPTNFQEPSGLERVKICPIDGLLPNKYCPNPITELFIKGTAPTKVSDIYRSVVIDKTTGRLAGPSTPPENREEKVIEVYPPEWAAWAKAAGKPAPPQPAVDQSPGQSPQPVASTDSNGSLVVDSPLPGSAIKGQVNIHGTASGKAFASFKVEYGEGLNPTSWKPIGGIHTMPVNNGILERWDTASLNGLYTLRITMATRPAATPTVGPPPPLNLFRSTPQAISTPTPVPAPVSTSAPKVIQIPVIVDNQPPTAAITFPRNNASLSKDQTPKITFSAQVSDNHKVAQTDFYLDGQLIGSSSASPATLDWNCVPGQHVLHVIVKDSAGNQTTSSDVRFQVK